MEKSNEFQGKTLDSAIEAACEYFDVPREKLEVEIINDAKAGIFGLVGAKKATILARKTTLASTAASVLSDRLDDEARPGCSGPARDSARENRQRESSTPKRGDGPRVQESQSEPKKEGKRTEPGDGARQNRRALVRGVSKRAAYPVEKGPFRQTRAPLSSEKGEQEAFEDSPVARTERPAKDRPNLHAVSFLDSELSLQDDGEPVFEGLPVIPLEQLDAEKLSAETLAAVRRIVSTIVRDARYAVRIEDGRVNVSIESNEDSGLLIGREGQTLSSVQYLVSRIVSKAMGASVPLQLDAGDYRERQDEKLREMARQLARRVHETGRPHSTRPLSSYHRRVVHMTLQDDAEIQTRSKGEGPLKRVILFRKSGKPGAVDYK